MGHSDLETLEGTCRVVLVHCPPFPYDEGGKALRLHSLPRSLAPSISLSLSLSLESLGCALPFQCMLT